MRTLFLISVCLLFAAIGYFEARFQEKDQTARIIQGAIGFGMGFGLWHGCPVKGVNGICK
jgi:hypothetical protein